MPPNMKVQPLVRKILLCSITLIVIGTAVIKWTGLQTTSKLHIFTLDEFAANSKIYPMISSHCVETKLVMVRLVAISFPNKTPLCFVLQPTFRICVYDPSHDIWVSSEILRKGYWEQWMAEWFLSVKKAYAGDFLYLDVGANIGIHGLHAAKAGATVWAVEPQAKNLQKVQLG